MYQFLESIKLENGEVFNLDLHQQRIERTFVKFTRKNGVFLEKILINLKLPETGLFKLRVTYNLKSEHHLEVLPYIFSQPKTFALIENNTLDYSSKFLDRNIFDEMKQSTSADEIIIVKNNLVTDASYANLLFLKNDRWFTPRKPLLKGVQRENLLISELIEEDEINLTDLSNFSHFQLINAMRNFNAEIFPISSIINFQDFK